MANLYRIDANFKDVMCLQGSSLRPAGGKRAELERHPYE